LEEAAATKTKEETAAAAEITKEETAAAEKAKGAWVEPPDFQRRLVDDLRQYVAKLEEAATTKAVEETAAAAEKAKEAKDLRQYVAKLEEAAATKTKEETAAAAEQPKVLLYFATHGSEEHRAAMECQARLLAKTFKMARADVLVYIGSDDQTLNRTRWHQTMRRFPNPVYRLRFGDNPGKQAGAKKAAHMLFSRGWASGYDWVVRLNPDVFVHNESLLFGPMADEGTWAVLGFCCFPVGVKKDGCGVNTDIFAVRPSRISNDSFALDPTRGARVAEVQAGHVFGPLISNNRVRWLPNDAGVCHLQTQGAGIFHGLHNAKDMRTWEDKYLRLCYRQAHAKEKIIGH